MNLIQNPMKLKKKHLRKRENFIDKVGSIMAAPSVFAFFLCGIPAPYLRASDTPTDIYYLTKEQMLIAYIGFIFWCVCAIITVICVSVLIIYNILYGFTLIIIKLKYYNIYRKDISKFPISVQKYCDKYNIFIPDEFKDPITHTLMVDPILLPMTNKIDIFISKVSIYKCLEIERRNPFDRQYLDLNILTEYNNREDIIAKRDNFNNKLSEWKNLIMKKIDFTTS